MSITLQHKMKGCYVVIYTGTSKNGREIVQTIKDAAYKYTGTSKKNSRETDANTQVLGTSKNSRETNRCYVLIHRYK